MGYAHDDVRNADQAEKAAIALAMRRKGASYNAIAKELGYANATCAKRLIDWSFQRKLRENLEEARELELERLDSYAAKAEELYTVDPAAGLDRLAKLTDLRCKIQGLYAATKTEVTGKDGGEIQIGPSIAQAKMSMKEFFGGVTPKSDEEPKADVPVADSDQT